MLDNIERVVVWFSCGATSAVAAKIALKECAGRLPVYVVYTDPGSEHPDNKRFIADCEKWFDQPITVLKNPKYANIYDVFEKTRYLVGVAGARCTAELKKKLRHEFEKVWSDLQVFGFDASEQNRADRFAKNNPEVNLWTPLIDKGLHKTDCLAMIEKAGIELPEMYKLGYRNNNCIGCVKGQSGYWNKIRVDFPEVFERTAKVERELNVAINKSYAGDGKRKRVFLDELPPDAGRYTEEGSIECGVLCVSTYNEVCDD
jgi:3'-phosphoadenosine 5'-phosphosulfate sulfotransferase (PAPS reductase)/FAD synthetase